MSAVADLLRPPRRARVIGALAALAVATLILWYVGMDLWHAIAIGLGLAAIAISGIAVPEHDGVEWAPERTEGTDGARREVLQLSWSLRTRYGRVQNSALRRVQDLARYRLSLRGLDLGDPAHRGEIERLLGAGVYRTLCVPGKKPPYLRSVVRCLDAIEGLDSRGPDANRPDATRKGTT